MADIGRTFGALLVGGITAAVFSGIVTAQTFSYFNTYPKDATEVKLLIGVVWFLDFCHTIFVSTSLWDHLIAHFGSVERIDYVPWSLALTIAFTAILTFLVHLFFIYRIFVLSNRNYFFAIPLTLLACARLCFACLTTAKLITLRSLKRFVELYTFSFTSGLALSSLIDVLVTGLLCYLLLSHKQNSNLNGVLDKLLLYTFENGSMTCAAAFTSLVCWLTNHSTSLVFMGLHFVISKLYANSLLASLNTRKGLQANRHPISGNLTTLMFPDNRKGVETISTVTQGMRTQVERTQTFVSETVSGGTLPRDSLAKGPNSLEGV